jgi:hypothetical protein
VVNREVKGLPDEDPYGYYGVNSIRQSVLQPYFNNGTTLSVTYLNAIAEGLYDTKPDVYHVSMGGMNFSFKLGENNVPYLLSQHNYKVTYTPNQITVTDDNGVTYYFSEKETSSSLGEFDDINGSFGNGHAYTSSWFISRIKISATSSIFFNYANKPQVESYTFQGTSYVNMTLIPFNAPCGNSNWGGSQSYSKTVTDQKILTSVTFDQGNIFFQRTPHDFYELYTGINVEDKNGNSIYDYDLTYENINRDLLTGIDKNGENYYDFEYLNKNLLPDFVNDRQDIPTAMDWWGYYNGKTGNTVITSVPGRPNAPDKDPSMRHTVAGALVKIINPTRGTTELFYEQNQILSSADQNDIGLTTIPSFNRRLQLQMQGDPSQTKEETFSYTFTEDTFVEISHDVKAYTGTFVELHMQAPGPATYGNYVNHAEELRLQGSTDPTFDITQQPFHANFYIYGIGDGGDNANQLSWFRGDSGGVIKILAGTYNFRLKTWGVSTYGNSSIKLEMKFYKDTNSAGNPTATEEEYVTIGGVRVREIKTCPTNGSEEGCTTRSFEYDEADDYNQGNFTYTTHVRKTCQVPMSQSSGGNSGQVQYVVYNLNRRIYNYKSFTSINFNGGVPVYYKKVREGFGITTETETVQTNYDYINDLPVNTNDDGTYIVTLANGSRPNRIVNIYHPHYKGGYVDNSYFSPSLNSNLSFPFTPETSDLKMGRLQSSETHKYNTPANQVIASYDIVKKNDIDYSQFRDVLSGAGYSLTAGYPLGLNVARKISFEGGSISIPQNEIHNYFYYDTYGELKNRFLTASEVSTEYFDGNTLVNSIFNTYNAQVQPSIVRKVDSEGTVKKTTSTYVHELSNPTPDEQLLITQNKMNTVIETKVYVENSDTTESLLETKKTAYKDFGSGQVLPEKVFSAKGNYPLEERILFGDYDTKGNPIEFSKTGGIKVYTVFGYNRTLPIAKIENTTQINFTQQQIDAINDAIASSNADTSAATEDTLRDDLNILRSLFPNAMVTTATFDPIVGMTSMTDTKGYTTFYEYNSLNQLESIKDADKNILKSYEYNRKNN